MKLDTNKLNESGGIGAPNAFCRVLVRLRNALAYAIQHETEREDQDAYKTEFADHHLPEPPHLEPGELKYGNGMHDYF
jgi:hypothetical protein